MHTNYYQLPPDGAGKKVFAKKFVVIRYNNGVVPINTGDVITGYTSGLSMLVLNVLGTVTSGVLYLSFLDKNNESDVEFLNGEIIQVGTTTCAYVSGTPEYYFHNTGSLTSADDPHNGLMIDSQGQMYTRYGEGSQLLDGAGRTKMSESRKIGVYGFSRGTREDIITYETSGGGTYVYNPVNRSLKLSVDNVIGSSVVMTTDKYHPFMQDQSLYMEMTINLSDYGKTGLRRRGGMFDLQNGFFFELTDQTFSFKMRFNSTGTVEEYVVNQSDFNGDKGDGTGISKQIWDFTRINRFWIDFFPGSRVRFGGYTKEGYRVIFHTMTLGNTFLTRPININGLPVRFEMENVDSTAGPSDMTVNGVTITLEGDDEYIKRSFEVSTNSLLPKETNDTTWIPLISIKPDETWDNQPIASDYSNVERSLAHITRLSISSIIKDVVPETDGRIKVVVFENPTLTGTTWSVQKGSFIVDTAATTITGGMAIEEFYIKGTDNKDLDFDMLYGLIHNKYNGTPNIVSVAARSLTPTQVCQVNATITWKEISI